MQKELQMRAEQYAKQNRRKKRWLTVIGMLILVVFAGTYHIMIHPALGKEGQTDCDIEEHHHTEACYEEVLICGQEETKYEPSHIHTPECIKEEKVLICPQEESQPHIHSEACISRTIDENGEEVQSIICGQQEGEGGHTHTEACYQIQRQQICGQEENTQEGHHHTEQCYEKRRICGKEEHEHTKACQEEASDPDADLETTQMWEQSLEGVVITGNWAKDVLLIAESQLGYQESTKNYIYAEDGSRKKGITRYGQWYGDPYGDWCAMFVSFCLHYAKIPQDKMPYEANCARWIEELKKPEWNRYQEAGSYEPVLGDLIFFDWDQDERSDHIGFVYEKSDTYIKTIEGNAADQVQIVTYDPNDSVILGYGILPEKEMPVKMQKALQNTRNQTLVAFVEEDGVVQEITEVVPGASYTYRQILGEAVQYGITANEVRKVAHMDSTFAAGVLISPGENVTAGLFTEHIGGSYMIGEVQGQIAIDGDRVGIYTTSEAANKIRKDANSFFIFQSEAYIKQWISNQIQSAAARSNQLASQITYEVLRKEGENWIYDQNLKTIDLSGYGPGTYYIKGDRFLSMGETRIYKNSDQNIVFQFEGTEVELRRFYIENRDGIGLYSSSSQAEAVPLAESVIFNMPNATDVRLKSEIFGIILAPHAHVVAESTCSGWVVSNIFSNPGGEWHFMNRDLPLLINVDVNLKKRVNGQVPTESQSFQFQLETMVAGVWTSPEELTNQGEQITFSRTYAQPGTHYYRIQEKQGNDDTYRYDDAIYVIKVEVSKVFEQGESVLVADITYYRETEAGPQVEEVIFQNSTSEEEGFVLPDTGASGGMKGIKRGWILILIAGGSLFYKKRKKKERGSII